MLNYSHLGKALQHIGFLQGVDLPKEPTWADIESGWIAYASKHGASSLRQPVYVGNLEAPSGDLVATYKKFESGELPEVEAKKKPGRPKSKKVSAAESVDGDGAADDLAPNESVETEVSDDDSDTDTDTETNGTEGASDTSDGDAGDSDSDSENKTEDAGGDDEAAGSEGSGDTNSETDDKSDSAAKPAKSAKTAKTSGPKASKAKSNAPGRRKRTKTFD